MTKHTVRLCFEVFADGSRQVREATWQDKATTSECEKVTVKLCPRCHEFIGRTRHHMVRGAINGDQYFHVNCARQF